MRRFLVLLLFLWCVMHAGAAVQIIEFCPDPHSYEDADEYLVLSGTGSLDGITISDGQGWVSFPPGHPD